MLRAGGSHVTQKCRSKDVKVMVGPAELVLHKVLTATVSSAMTHPQTAGTSPAYVPRFDRIGEGSRDEAGVDEMAEAGECHS